MGQAPFIPVPAPISDTISSQLASLAARLTSQEQANASLQQMLSLSQRVTQLQNTTITSPTIASPTVSGTLNLTDASGSLTVAGDATIQKQLTVNATTATSTYSTGGLAIGTNQLVVQQTSGNVGVGTSSPVQLLSIAGHCVTGDTRLRRRRRKKKNTDGEWEYNYDEVPIKDIQQGDEIASLDEATGMIVWSRVNALMDMGVKTTYRLKTENGREIRTTTTHPYLVREMEARKAKHPSPIAGAGWLTADAIKTGDYIAAPKPKLGVFIDGANAFYSQRRAKWRLCKTPPIPCV